MKEGMKYDRGKLRWNLLPFDVLENVVRVLMHGAEKYADHNWKKVENAKERYFNAAMRHIVAWYYKKEKLDKESGLHHLAHAICDLVFLLYFEKGEDTK